jgi:probable rRNA maturation factor
VALNLSIAADGVVLPASRPQLRRWVMAACLKNTSAQLHLRFVTSAAQRHMNHKFRGKDYATNVLTFPMQHTATLCQADILICPAVVKKEAREQGKTFAHHLAHLVMHGVLHAHGYDHETRAQAARMEGLEVTLLARFGILNPYE